MTTAADVIAAFNQRRLLRQGQLEPAGDYPEGWRRWFDGLRQTPVEIRHAPPQALVDALVQHPQQTVGPKGGLGTPFFQLLRLQRPFDPREERKLRIGAGVADLLLHLVLAALLLWLMYLRFLAMAQQPDDDAGDVVQVEFIGRGNAVEGGGALANAGAESAPAAAAAGRRTPAPPAASTAASAEASPTLEQQAIPTPQRLDARREVPRLEPVPPAAAAQVLQVSEVPQPQPEAFQLPPPRERNVQAPQVQLRDIQPNQQVEQLVVLDARPVQVLRPIERDVPLRQPVLKQQVQALETFTPDATALTRERTLPARARQQAQVQVPALQGQVRELPLPSAAGGGQAAEAGRGSAAAGDAAAQGAGGQRSQATGNGQAAAGTGAGARAAQAGGRGVASNGAGAGPGQKAAPGGWPGQAKSDDWGASSRNVAGTGSGHGNGNGQGRNGDGKAGLFNDDGSPRLPDQWSKNATVDLDRSGTWLKRPGLEYRGTRFDQYWIPEGNLLQEWVRRGVKELSIPIPGSKLKLKCVVSLLQFGGGCLPVNPDANEQNSTGRKAPDVPFKPQLQEDNGSVRPAPASSAEPAPPAG